MLMKVRNLPDPSLCLDPYLSQWNPSSTQVLWKYPAENPTNQRTQTKMWPPWRRSRRTNLPEERSLSRHIHLSEPLYLWKLHSTLSPRLWWPVLSEKYAVRSCSSTVKNVINVTYKHFTKKNISGWNPFVITNILFSNCHLITHI